MDVKIVQKVYNTNEIAILATISACNRILSLYMYPVVTL